MAFYTTPQKEIESVPQHDVVIVMGDPSTKVGHSDSGWESNYGKEGVAIINENGEPRADMCATHDLLVGALFSSIRTFTSLLGSHSERYEPNRPYHHQWTI